jgi:predicted amidohydrolase
MMQRTGLPRKVTVGTCWLRAERTAALAARIEKLARLVDEMAARAEASGRPLDIAVLPEDANLAGRGVPLESRAEDPATGPTVARLAEVARRHHTYIIIPHMTRIAEPAAPAGRLYNSAVLLGRDGAVLGRYDKLHGVETPELSGQIEDGCTPGLRAKTFDLDFGRIGIQICFDMVYDDGWLALEEAGAELVCWPSAYPGSLQLGYRAWRHGYYVVSSPWRPPCAIYEPTGHARAIRGQGNNSEDHGLPAVRATRETPSGEVLVETIDLEYALMSWKSAKDHGRALQEKYGDAIGLAYYEPEDVWLLWSNSQEHPVARILADNGLEPLRPYVERMRQLQDRLRGGPPLV